MDCYFSLPEPRSMLAVRLLVDDPQELNLFHRPGTLEGTSGLSGRW